MYETEEISERERKIKNDVDYIFMIFLFTLLLFAINSPSSFFCVLDPTVMMMRHKKLSFFARKVLQEEVDMTIRDKNMGK